MIDKINKSEKRNYLFIVHFTVTPTSATSSPSPSMDVVIPILFNYNPRLRQSDGTYILLNRTFDVSTYDEIVKGKVYTRAYLEPITEENENYWNMNLQYKITNLNVPSSTTWYIKLYYEKILL